VTDQEHNEPEEPVTSDASESVETDWFGAGDNAHQEALGSLPEESGRAMALARASIEHLWYPLAQNRIPEDALFANAVAGTACFGFAHRQLRGCLLLLHFGYYESVAPLLRSAYEAAACGQYLSRNPEAAQRWIDRGSWPRVEVRGRLGDRTRGEMYRQYYRLVSDLSHPTRRAVMDSVQLTEGDLVPMLFREIDPEKLRVTALVIASTAGFACFAFQNASPAGAMEPRWLRSLAQLAQATNDAAGTDYDYSHLERDWDAHQMHWEEIASRLRSNIELERALDEHPGSWRRAVRSHLGEPDEQSD
jgi:hypothetical protein